jgi:hypothetical protein
MYFTALATSPVKNEKEIKEHSPLKSTTAMDKCLAGNNRPPKKFDPIMEQKLTEAVLSVEGLLEASNCKNEEDVLKGQIEALQGKQVQLVQDKQHIELLKDYKEISLGFLKMGKPGPKTIQLRGEPIKTVVPLFSIHHIKMNREVEWGETASDKIVKYNLSVGVAWVEIFIRDSTRKIEGYATNPNPKILSQPYSEFLVKEQNLGNRSHSKYEIRDEFKGIIPEETKDKIKEAHEKCENGELDNIWLIKEAEWNLSKVTEDPLIIGILGNRAYLIDHFDCTDIEKWVKAEFSL